jgi:hypothetical protein
MLTVRHRPVHFICPRLRDEASCMRARDALGAPGSGAPETNLQNVFLGTVRQSRGTNGLVIHFRPVNAVTASMWKTRAATCYRVTRLIHQRINASEWQDSFTAGESRGGNPRGER